MAVWQYDFIVVPRDELSTDLGNLPRKIADDKFKTAKFWTTRQPAADYAATFSTWRPELRSWSSDLRMWGDEQSNRIDVSYGLGKVSNVEFRIELRSLSIRFIDLLSDFARKSNCVLVSAHSLRVVEPIRADILTHLCKSHGANNVWDWLNGSTMAMTWQPVPRLFLSHSSADKRFVHQLAVDLTSRRIPVWFDKWELKVGDSLSAKISEGINSSGWLAVVLSKNSVESPWFKKELNAALARELRDQNVFVLPIVLDDCKIPLFLLDKVFADFRQSYADGIESLVNRVLEGGEVK
jgi:hypothetical protein